MAKSNSILNKLKATESNVVAAETRLHKVLCDPEFGNSPFFREVLLARCDLLTSELLLNCLINFSDEWKDL